jgi:peptide/nickel transport system permease protein
MASAEPPIALPSSVQVERQSKILRAFAAYFLWPLLVPLALILAPFRGRLAGRLGAYPVTTDVLLMPVKLIRFALRKRLWALSTGLTMMAPLLLFALLDLVTVGLVGTAPSSAIIQHPSFWHWFGTDGLGRDLFWLVVGGAGTTYEVALVATTVALAIGVPLGLATLRRRTDALVMTGVELVEALPVLVWVLMLMTVYAFWTDAVDPESFARRIFVVMRVPFGGLVLGVCVAPRVVRLVRDQVKFFEREDFIALTRAHGVSTRRILWFHILRKNTLPDLLLVGAALPSLAILTQINLDYFFSIGSFRSGAAHYTSWTQLLLTGEARRALLFFENWWTVVLPSTCVVMTTVGCLLWGDGLRNLRRRHDIESEDPLPARSEIKTPVAAAPTFQPTQDFSADVKAEPPAAAVAVPAPAQPGEALPAEPPVAPEVATPAPSPPSQDPSADVRPQTGEAPPSTPESASETATPAPQPSQDPSGG